MKKQYLLLPAALLLAGAAHAQGTELFFSEYDEGAHQSGVNYGGVATPANPSGNSTGNERAIEVFNPTRTAVNLNPYSIRRYSNGSATPVEEEKLFRSDANQVAVGANTLSAQATFVLANGQATLPVIRSAANQFSAGYQTAAPTVITLGGTTYFNGDDAMALVRYPSGTAGMPSPSAGVIIDIIGVIGVQPPPSGSGGTGSWSGFNPIDDIPGTPPTHVFVSTGNQSIVRRDYISTGVRTNPTSFNPADEWMRYSSAFDGPGGTSDPGGQLYTGLGSHDYSGPLSTRNSDASLQKFNNAISLYPNPASGTATVELKDVKVGSIVVLNSLGQRIVAQPSNAASQTISLDISGLKTGLYFVQFISADGQTRIFKELVVK